eukprot:GFUD01083679.1.p1 GENE.GFUD01083679.1~~GFUD01083679.1.p1  ORF type:complete len:115 (+),score=21.15 GFUD01083679.1:25-345(+)
MKVVLLRLVIATVSCGQQPPSQGYRRGNTDYNIEEYFSQKKSTFKSKVKWQDAHGGHGEHYYDHNHNYNGPEEVNSYGAHRAVLDKSMGALKMTVKSITTLVNVQA